MSRKIYSQSQMDDKVHEVSLAARHKQIQRSAAIMQAKNDQIHELELKLAAALDINGAQARVVAAETLVRAHEKALEQAHDKIAELEARWNTNPIAEGFKTAVDLDEQARLHFLAMQEKNNKIAALESDLTTLAASLDAVEAENTRLRTGRA